MKNKINFLWPIVFTAFAFLYGYYRDSADGTIVWPLLVAGTVIAGLGVWCGIFIIDRVERRLAKQIISTQSIEGR